MCFSAANENYINDSIISCHLFSNATNEVILLDRQDGAASLLKVAASGAL